MRCVLRLPLKRVFASKGNELFYNKRLALCTSSLVSRNCLIITPLSIACQRFASPLIFYEEIQILTVKIFNPEDPKLRLLFCKVAI